MHASETPSPDVPGQESGRDRPSRRQLVASGVVIALLGLAAIAAVAAVTSSERAPRFQGNLLEPPKETLPFTLTNQFGRTVQWSDYRGKVVVLTFLYTFCPDLCPLTTAKLKEAHRLLGKDAARVAFVAMTVDPERDTPERVRVYSQGFDMLDKWEFLVGSEAQLRPLWQGYWAGEPRKVVLDREGNVVPCDQPTLSTEEKGTACGAEYAVEHGAPVHIIDQKGWGRVVYGSTFLPAELAHDIRLLLARNP